MPDGLPLPLYFAMLDYHEREMREIRRQQNKKSARKAPRK